MSSRPIRPPASTSASSPRRPPLIASASAPSTSPFSSASIDVTRPPSKRTSRPRTIVPESSRGYVARRRRRRAPDPASEHLLGGRSPVERPRTSSCHAVPGRAGTGQRAVGAPPLQVDGVEPALVRRLAPFRFVDPRSDQAATGRPCPGGRRSQYSSHTVQRRVRVFAFGCTQRRPASVGHGDDRPVVFAASLLRSSCCFCARPARPSSRSGRENRQARPAQRAPLSASRGACLAPLLTHRSTATGSAREPSVRRPPCSSRAPLDMVASQRPCRGTSPAHLVERAPQDLCVQGCLADRADRITSLPPLR